MAGQGTTAKELIEEIEEIDVLIAPLGGGGLLSGCALAAKTMNPNCKVIGVEPEAGNDGQQSFRSGKLVQIATPVTIADGTQTPRLGDLTFPVIQRHVDDVLTVSDAELVDALPLASNLIYVANGWASSYQAVMSTYCALRP
jgi:threonine dehydratase